jgi:hypothetical protein
MDKENCCRLCQSYEAEYFQDVAIYLCSGIESDKYGEWTSPFHCCSVFIAKNIFK